MSCAIKYANANESLQSNVVLLAAIVRANRETVHGESTSFRVAVILFVSYKAWYESSLEDDENQ
jgi:hypothetical protein